MTASHPGINVGVPPPPASCCIGRLHSRQQLLIHLHQPFWSCFDLCLLDLIQSFSIFTLIDCLGDDNDISITIREAPHYNLFPYLRSHQQPCATTSTYDCQPSFFFLLDPIFELEAENHVPLLTQVCHLQKELKCQHHYHLVESWCPKYIQTERRCVPTIVSKQYW